MEKIVTIILLIFGILQIILFFKIWGMTDDIREIKNKYLLKLDTHSENNTSGEKLGIAQGSIVVNLKTEKQMKVGERTPEGKYKCYSELTYMGEFSDDEVMEFDKWVVTWKK